MTSTVQCLKGVAAMLAVMSALSARALEAQEPPRGVAPAVGTVEETTSARAAIDSLRQLPVSVQRLREVVKATSFGPFRISGSCTYSQWYCFGIRCIEFSWWWDFPQYQSLRGGLDAQYQNVERVSSQFESRFSPVRSWLVGTLPAVARDLHDASVWMEAAEVAERNHASPEKIDRYRTSMLRAADRAVRTLREGSRELQAALGGLATFNDELSSSMQGIEALRAQLEHMIRRDESDVVVKMSAYPCGVDDARGKYEAVKRAVRDQFQRVVTAGQGSSIQASQSEEALSVILGRLLNLASSSESVIQSFEGAKLTPAGAMHRLQWSVVEASWRELAEYAAQNLGG